MSLTAWQSLRWRDMIVIYFTYYIYILHFVSARKRTGDEGSIIAKFPDSEKVVCISGTLNACPFNDDMEISLSDQDVSDEVKYTE